MYTMILENFSQGFEFFSRGSGTYSLEIHGSQVLCYVRSVLVRIVFRTNLSGDQYRKASTMLEIVYNIRR